MNSLLILFILVFCFVLSSIWMFFCVSWGFPVISVESQLIDSRLNSKQIFPFSFLSDLFKEEFILRFWYGLLYTHRKILYCLFVALCINCYQWNFWEIIHCPFFKHLFFGYSVSLLIHKNPPLYLVVPYAVDFVDDWKTQLSTL